MGEIGREPTQAPWMTLVEDCDVQDKDALRRYRAKRIEWLDWLLGDDDHAIGRQIYLMNWSYITFRVLNEACRIASRRDLRSPVRNHVFFRFATEGFLATQALAIRRLNDKAAKTPELQIISLRRLVDDVDRHHDLFTRELFVGFDGAPFDTEPSRQRWWELAKKQFDAGGGVACWGEEYNTAGPEAWRHAERLHDKFDRLCGIDSKHGRTRSDRIPRTVFTKLITLLDDPVIGKVRALANKRIAHAADMISRLAVEHDTHGTSLNNLDQVHRNLFTVTSFILSVLLSKTNIGTVPIPQFDAFEYLDAGGLDDSALDRMRRLANALAERRERWAQMSAEAILSPGTS
jgi:hypothetical protein